MPTILPEVRSHYFSPIKIDNYMHCLAPKVTSLMISFDTNFKLLS